MDQERTSMSTCISTPHTVYFRCSKASPFKDEAQAALFKDPVRTAQ
jgi:hypothetical protein